ncbi:(3,5-dihydroxyphenyl)acetyl-CoA 1,2-dioxygenase DpgC [Micromonospora okii]|uniref:(3,5-dihydroxyphenyl)acetyl-CoA 1,2-dioxygenase DpgC n=1 Tax=Micromonospora okii TaxID=1182970 RepID=UPI00272E9B26|nr:(3,5-dihydroxyphenyl)acetyl-CoA 1,2-dioxygenase DpgC [Micromonospora okii]
MRADLRARVERWQGEPPTAGHSLEADTAALSAYTEHGEELLAALPARRDRDDAEQHLADRVHAACRAARDRFVGWHVDAVHAVLTDGRSVHRGVAELAADAAEAFPGLVPTSAQLAAERALPQRDKEGREIDQGIFFRGLLRSPSAGPHLLESMRRPTARAIELLPRLRSEGGLDLGPVALRCDAGVARLTMQNLHCLNAEDDRQVAAMETAVDLALLHDDVRVLVLRGGVMTHPRYAGRRVFSAGINLRDLVAGQISFTGFLLGRELGYVSKLVHGLRLDDGTDVQRPWVAAVDTFAIGGGMQLLLVADRVIAGADAWFSLPAAKEGIVPGAANLRLARLTGARLARRIILGGRRIHARDPDAGLVCDDVVPPEEVGSTAERASAELGSAAVLANRRMLNLAEEPTDGLRAYLAEFAYVQACRLHSPDVVAKAGALG